MVLITEVINKLKKQILHEESLNTLAYLRLRDYDAIKNLNLDRFFDIEKVAAYGYEGKTIDREYFERSINRPQNKGTSYSENVFQLVGLYLSFPNEIRDKLNKKFINTSIKNKYFISKFDSAFLLSTDSFSPKESVDFIIGKILGFNVDDKQLIYALQYLIQNAKDVIDLLILEDYYSVLVGSLIVKNRFLDKDSKTLVCDVLNEFSNSVRKITQNRREGHEVFTIKDEYDVQDLLYFLLKSIFPTLKEEDPTPRVGGKFNRIDLIIREEEILIEVKMIKSGDSNEKKFVEELKTDIQSYYQCQWLKHLICFVYDPYKKTKDKQNFYDLIGPQSIKNVNFYVDVIVSD